MESQSKASRDREKVTSIEELKHWPTRQDQHGGALASKLLVMPLLQKDTSHCWMMMMMMEMMEMMKIQEKEHSEKQQVQRQEKLKHPKNWWQMKVENQAQRKEELKLEDRRDHR